MIFAPISGSPELISYTFPDIMEPLLNNKPVFNNNKKTIFLFNKIKFPSIN